MLSKLNEELSLGNPRFRVLCPSKWTVRAESLKSVLDNWGAINMLWDISLEEKLDPAMRGRIIGVQMCWLDFYFGVYVLQFLLRHSDNLSKALQNFEISACEGQALAALSIKTLEKMRNNDSFDSKRNTASLDLSEPTITRKCKKPAKYLGEQETPQYNDITKAKLMHKRVYFNAIDTIIA